MTDPDHRFLVDPIDGTTNFLNGQNYTITIALRRAGETLCGVVYDPVADELFTAVKGGGAFLNGERLRVSPSTEVRFMCIGTGLPTPDLSLHPGAYQRLDAIRAPIGAVRVPGSAALACAMVACGRLTGYFEETGFTDTAAGLAGCGRGRRCGHRLVGARADGVRAHRRTRRRQPGHPCLPAGTAEGRARQGPGQGQLRDVTTSKRCVAVCEDVAMGWQALEQWGDDVARIERLAGGVANQVWSVRVDGQLAVARLGARSDADLAWETDLMLHLDRAGLTVPVPIPTTSGRLFADGVVVMTYVEGGPPETEADWRRVADTLRQLHRLTKDWPQRPGWRSSTDLLDAEIGTKVDLHAMPAEAVARCRAAWARLSGRPTCVVHGDPNPGNIRLTAERVAMIDWDEAHVDVADLDLVLPHNAADLDDEAYDIAAQASAAWEAAVCWDDDHASEQLSRVRPV